VVMRAAFRFTVCDVGFCLEPENSPYPGIGEGRNRIARATVASADHVVAVCNATPLGLKNFLWSFEQVADLADPDGVVVVANRVASGAEKEVADLLRRHVGKRPVAYVPARQNDFARAAMDGRPVREIAPGSDVCAAMKAVVAAFGGRVRPSGLLSRLSGRK
jgi:CO dehydrogenase nickel-insertion accessory protein CooC1